MNVIGREGALWKDALIEKYGFGVMRWMEVEMWSGRDIHQGSGKILLILICLVGKVGLIRRF